MKSVVVGTEFPGFIHKGKVRDTYDLGEGLLLMVVTDRLSAFDVVLPTAIPLKGWVLARLSRFWFRRLDGKVPHHFIGLADEPEVRSRYGHLPLLKELPPHIARQSMVVRRAKRLDAECIARGYLAGSAWAEYRKSGTINGQRVAKGLAEGSRLPEVLFTPTTKAETGHDENMSIEALRNLVGAPTAEKLASLTKRIYSDAAEYARTKGIIVADTKMEFGVLNGEVIVIDELLTPDSSRFWDAALWKPGSSPPNFDKQFVRDWLSAQPWNKEPPAPALPDDVLRKTTERYLEALWRLAGEKPQE